MGSTSQPDATDPAMFVCTAATAIPDGCAPIPVAVRTWDVGGWLCVADGPVGSDLHGTGGILVRHTPAGVAQVRVVIRSGPGLGASDLLLAPVSAISIVQRRNWVRIRTAIPARIRRGRSSTSTTAWTDVTVADLSGGGALVEGVDGIWSPQTTATLHLDIDGSGPLDLPSTVRFADRRGLHLEFDPMPERTRQRIVRRVFDTQRHAATRP